MKFHLPKGSRAIIQKYSQVAAAAAARCQLVSTYFDTPDRALDRCGLTLRVRQDGAIRTQTVKSRSDGLGIAANRGEWAWPIDQDVPDVEWLSKTKPLTTVAHSIRGQLEPVFNTNVRRTARILHLGEGTIVELAFDEGHIEAGSASEAISEMELELKSGDVGPLYQFAAALQSIAPIWLMSESKAARGWHLRTGAYEGAKFAQTPNFKRKVSAAEGFRQLLGGVLGHLTSNIGPTLHGDPEGLHQSRIAIREARALLRLFEPYLDSITAQPFNAALRSIARVFGAARDWDVFCLETLPAAKPELSGDRLEDLNAAAEVERQLAHEGVGQTLRGREYSRLVLDLVVWAQGNAIDTSRDCNDLMRHRLSALAPSLLHRSASRVERRGRHIGRLSVVKRHSLRKSLKKLSFDAENLACFFGAKGVKNYLRCSEALAKALGAANDAVVTARLTRILCNGSRPELLEPARVLERWNKVRKHKALNDLKPAMRDFRSAPEFWT